MERLVGVPRGKEEIFVFDTLPLGVFAAAEFEFLLDTS